MLEIGQSLKIDLNALAALVGAVGSFYLLIKGKLQNQQNQKNKNKGKPKDIELKKEDQKNE